MLQGQRNQVNLTLDAEPFIAPMASRIVFSYLRDNIRLMCKGILNWKLHIGSILVMDVEGTDGREKEDQKAFEGKSALFSLALTDIMMVNMWMHEVGRFNAANLPLLKTVFEVCPFRFY